MKLYLLLGVFIICGCDEQTSRVDNVQVESTNSINADDFALNSIGGLIKGGLSDANALEREINKPGDDNPYTRVDINGDGKRDIILVDEVEHGSKFEFIAHPGDGVPDQSIAVATFTMDGGQTHYHANYTSYVRGYDNPDYRYYDTFAHDLLWVGWLSSPRSVYMGVPTRYAFYRTQPRVVFHTTQTTVFHTTNIRVTPPAPRSMTFSSSSYTSKVTPPHSYSSSRTTSSASHPITFSSMKSLSSTPRSSSTPSKSSFSSKSFSSSSRRR
ncbi:hypothetical protein M0R72_00475 [Candidatus Pacearchaeota archaeon]|nr:hypothetical protein [Candidatus Pacearchaeota archaeon]